MPVCLWRILCSSHHNIIKYMNSQSNILAHYSGHNLNWVWTRGISIPTLGVGKKRVFSLKVVFLGPQYVQMRQFSGECRSRVGMSILNGRGSGRRGTVLPSDPPQFRIWLKVSQKIYIYLNFDTHFVELLLLHNSCICEMIAQFYNFAGRLSQLSILY